MSSKKDFRFGISSAANGLDLNQLLLTHPANSFYMRMAEDAPDLDLHRSDILIIDRSLSPHKHDLTVVSIDGEQQLKIVRWDKKGEPMELWGVVTFVIKKVRQ